MLFISLFIIAVVILFLLFLMVIWRLSVKSQSPRRMPIEVQPTGEYESIEFQGSAWLKGWLLWPTNGQQELRNEPLSVIIISHGWASNRARVLRYVEPFRAAGHAVIVYDVASHGESGAVKAPSALLFRDDLLAAVRYAHSRPELDAARIGILGHSLGGFGAMLALDEGLEVQAIVTDSMPANPFTMITAELKRRGLPIFPLAQLVPRIWLLRSRINRADFDAINIRETILRNERRGAGRVPLYMIHSMGDTFIPPSELQGIITDLPYELPHLFVHTNGHSCSEQDPAFWEAVLPFLNQHVKQVAVSPHYSDKCTSS
ncbi:alpha/beta hydrolase [Paenibacillus arenosi]|uniref:Alpha/beta fold hydrolase n=1 Tax=Paenibacillus arenosi TaxID=2774142 RepID=A0ABR9AWY7_9BACL|nr:alpha/beta fold hydrolase [Paenibacillus arenosi]MBD8498401.1 alpha/beta fold hydrolase [Paenibacillus arenosi]